VGDLEVRRSVDGTRPTGVQLRVWQSEDAVTARRAAGVKQRQDVGTAPDVAQVALDAASQLHPTVASSADEDDVMTAAAADVDWLHIAVLVHNQRRLCNAMDMSRCMQSIRQSIRQNVRLFI